MYVCHHHKIEMTKAERKAIYRRALKKLDGSGQEFIGLCALFLSIGYDIYHSSIEGFPELAAQRPKHWWKVKRADGNTVITSYWWKPSNWAPRRRALQRAIDACKPKPKP